MSTSKSFKSKKVFDNKSVAYTCAGVIPLENCVTAATDNLIVNLDPSLTTSPPSTGSSSAGKKKSDHYQDEDAENKVLVGSIHLDTFQIYEVIPNACSEKTETRPKEFTTKHLNSVQLPSSLQNRCVVFRSKWITVYPTNSCKSGLSAQPTSIPVKLLVLCTNMATFFYNELGTKQLFKFGWDGEANGGGNDEDGDSIGGSSRTIASTKEKILLGNERGEIYQLNYQVKEKKEGGNITHCRTLKVSSEPVAELCARKNGLLVIGTTHGSVSVWTGFEGDDGPIKSAEYVLSKPEPVTGILLWYPYAVVSYGSGIIRMFNLIQRVLSAQVFAHARWISSIDLCSSNLLISIAEDDEAKVWSLRRRQKGEQRTPIKLHSSIQIEDVNLIGGKFLNTSGSLVALANLGSKDIAVYAAATNLSTSV